MASIRDVLGGPRRGLAIRRPGGVRAVISFTARLLCGRPARPSARARAGSRISPWTGNREHQTAARSRSSGSARGFAAIRTGAGAGHFPKRRGTAPACRPESAPLNGFRHQVGRGDADRAAPCLKAGLGNAAVIGKFQPHLDAVAAHRVVPLGGGIETIQTFGMTRMAAVIQDHFLIQVAQIIECKRRALSGRTPALRHQTPPLGRRFPPGVV